MRVMCPAKSHTGRPLQAETIAILVVQLLVAGFASLQTQHLGHALFILSLYPLSIVLVAGLESVGYD